MVDQLVVGDAPAQPAPARRSRPRLIVLATVLALVAAGVVTAVKSVFHYTHAAPLACACGLGWAAPDNRHVHDSQAGTHSAMNVSSRAPARQSFYVEIYNNSDVTQTFLGLGHDESETAYRGVLAISTEPNYPSGKADADLRYTTKPLDIPPGGQYTMRYTFTAACLARGGALDFDGLDVKVRTGWFTRVERVDFDDTSFVVHGTKTHTGC